MSSWSAEVEYLHGVLGTTLGDVDFDLFSLALGWLARGRFDRAVQWMIGIGGRGMLVLRTPRPALGASGEQALRYTGGPWLCGDLELVVSEDLAVFGALEVGWLLRALIGRIDGEPLASMEGAWLRIAIGVAWAP